MGWDRGDRVEWDCRLNSQIENAGEERMWREEWSGEERLKSQNEKVGGRGRAERGGERRVD